MSPIEGKADMPSSALGRLKVTSWHSCIGAFSVPLVIFEFTNVSTRAGLRILFAVFVHTISGTKAC